MNRRTLAFVVLGGLALLLGPAVLPAEAAPSRPAAPATLIATTTKVKITQLVGTTPGKMLFAIHVKSSSGPAIPLGHVVLVVDSGTPILLTLKPTGRISYTSHYKPGKHSAEVLYAGSATCAPSNTGLVVFTVT